MATPSTSYSDDATPATSYTDDATPTAGASPVFLAEGAVLLMEGDDFLIEGTSVTDGMTPDLVLNTTYTDD